jgi:hypothetical protein
MTTVGAGVNVDLGGEQRARVPRNDKLRLVGDELVTPHADRCLHHASVSLP